MKKVLISALANVGFTLQIYGILLLFPLLSSIYFKEFDSSIGFGYALLISLVVGLFLTNFFKKVDLSFESVALMIPLTYIMLGFIGSIPYLFISNILFPNVDYLNIFINSYFESNSGFTTAGLSIINSVDSLPNSFIFYRGITQWLGGISIVSLMILFVNHPGESTKIIGEVAGIEKLKSTYRSTFIQVIKLYLVLTFGFIALLWLVGGINLFDSVNLVFTGISTSGFIPLDNLSSVINPASYFILIALMLVGATSFAIIYSLLGLKIRTSFYEMKFYFGVLISFILLGIIIVTAFDINNVGSVIFHFVSASTTTGFQYYDITNWPHSIMFLLLLLMFFGGMSFSTAGGLKTIRIILTIKSILWTIKKSTLPSGAIIPTKLKGKSISEKDMILVFVILFLGLFSILLGTMIFTLYGYDLSYALFEVTSAFTIAGLSVGITSLTLSPVLKIILVIEMLVGRVEIIPFLILMRILFKK